MRYQYTSSGFRKKFSNNPLSMPEGVKLLLIINISVYILIELSGYKNTLFQMFGLVPISVIQEFKFWQTITYLFIHGGFLHIFFNMFVLWMFGKDLEVDWGKKQFIIFYFLCGIGSGAITTLMSMTSFIPIVGASGAIYGMLVAYGFTYPNRMVYLYGIFPIKVKYMVLGLGIIAFLASVSTSQSSISHITHLSGMMIALLYIIYTKWKNVKLWYMQLKLKTISQNNITQNEEKELIKLRVDRILDKLNDSGWESLTIKEEEFLTNASKRLFDERSPN